MNHVSFTDNSDRVKADFNAQAIVALTAVGLEVEKWAKLELENSPRHVATGNLRNSITNQVSPSEMVVYVGTNVEYALWVHEGTGIYVSGGRKEPWAFKDSKGNWHMTRGIAPNHFLRNAVEKNRDKINNFLKNFMQ